MNEIVEHLTEIVINIANKRPSDLKELVAKYRKVGGETLERVRRGEMEFDSHLEEDKNLPHPIRAYKIAKCDAQSALMYEPENMAIFSLMAKECVPANDAMAHLNQVNLRNAKRFAESHGSRNGGAAYATAIPVYYKESNGKIFTFYNSLIRDLIKTDISDNVPSTLLRPPFASTYFKFGNENEDFGVYVNNSESGDHIIEGCYVLESTVPHILNNDAAKMVGILPDTPTRIVNLMFVGKPKATALDDATHNLTLYIQDSVPLTIEEVLENHFKYYSDKEMAKWNSEIDGYKIKESTDEEWNRVRECVKLLSKCMVYLNCAESRLTDVNEHTELLNRIKQLGTKKAIKHERKLSKVYDYVLVGTKESPFESAMKLAESQDSRFVKPHWRRGHIRMQRYGEELSKQKIIFISPVLINKDKLNSGESADREYKVK